MSRRENGIRDESFLWLVGAVALSELSVPDELIYILKLWYHVARYYAVREGSGVAKRA